MHKFLRHWFLPQYTNNHRPKILHDISILLLIIGIIGISTLSFVGKKSHSSVLGISYSISDAEMLTAVNEQRAQHGLAPLTMNSQLSQAASGKAANMFANNYWAHFGPDGTTPWQFIRGSGYDYIDAGENLAKGFTNSSDVVNAWMNSPTHRANVLSPKYSDIGFAIVPGVLEGEDTVLVVQMFGSREAIETAQVEVAPAAVQTVVQETVNPSSGLAQEQTVITLTPTPILVAVQPTSVPLVLNSNSRVSQNPIINIASYSKSMLLIIFVTLLVVFILDLLIIERRKIPRIVGHNIDHIMLIALFILFILLFKSEFVM